MADDDNKNEVGEVAKAVITTEILAGILTKKAAQLDANANPAPDLPPAEEYRLTSANTGSIAQWVKNSWSWFIGKPEQAEPGPAVEQAMKQHDKSCGCGLR